MTSLLPICFYPMRKIILDDDQLFTTSILLKMHDKNFIDYNSPHKALNYLLEEYQPTLTKADLIALNSSAENSPTHQTVNIHIEKLKQLLLKSKHQDISVLLVDFHMPEMNGLDFLKEIHHLPMKKALITSESDYRIAVNAFNQGLVDAYIRKDEVDFHKKIHQTITELEWKYFIELSSVISEVPEFNYLKNSHFLPVFNKFIKSNNIRAFCLTDMHGSFVAVNQQGEQKHLLIKNMTQLQELSRFAKEDGASLDTITNLKEGKVIPFFNDKEYWQIPANKWDRYLYPANTLHSDINTKWIAVS